VPLPDLPAAVAAADVVLSCTGAAGYVITRELVAAALNGRDPGRRNCRMLRPFVE